MGGSSTTTNTTINNHTVKNLHNTTNDIEKTRQEWNLHNIDHTTIEGMQIQGRTVDLSHSGNTGLRCVGMVEGDPNCRMAGTELMEMDQLMQLNFITSGLSALGGWAKTELEQAEHAFAVAGHYVYKGVVYTSKQAYAAALWCYHDQQCHDAAINLGKKAVDMLEKEWSDKHPVLLVLL